MELDIGDETGEGAVGEGEDVFNVGDMTAAISAESSF